MPLYEYRCGHCEKPFEKYARTFQEEPECPRCGAKDVTRLLSTFAVSTSGPAAASPESSMGGCGVGPPCGAAHCGRLPN